MKWLPRRRKVEIPEWLNVPWSIRDLVGFTLLWLGIQIVLLLVLDFWVPFVPAIAQFLHGVKDGNLEANFALNLLDAAVGLGLVWWYLRRHKVGWSAVGWRKVKLVTAVGYLLGALLVFVVAAQVLLGLVSILAPGFDPNQAQDNEIIRSAGAHPSIALIALVLLPPILEETIFRGFMFPALAKRTGVVWGAVISSAVFGIAHGQANIIVYTFILGLLLCFIYTRTKSLIPGVALHMLNNYLAFMALSGK